MAEDAWNTRSPERVALAYTRDSSWRNRSEFLSGREAIVQFLASDQMPEGGTRRSLGHWGVLDNVIGGPACARACIAISDLERRQRRDASLS